jgi:hypothetical protein
VVIVGFMIDVARGGDGSPYIWIGAIGGVVYLAALIVLRRRHRAPSSGALRPLPFREPSRPVVMTRGRTEAQDLQAAP